MSMMDPDLRQQWAENDEKKRKAEFAKEYAEREAKWKAANAKTGAASRAISPADASDGSAIPDLVYDVVNEMLREGKRRLEQNEVVERIRARAGVERSAVFQNGWLEFDDAYRAKGWKVAYDKPGYNESYGAFWEFSK